MPDRTGPTPYEGTPSARRSNGGGTGAAADDAETAADNSLGLTDLDRRTVDRLVASAREAQVEQIELQFADVTGAVKTVAVPARRLAHVLLAGEWFDGSALEGLAREVESDMYLRPDPSTFSILGPVAGVPCGCEKFSTIRRLFLNRIRE